jgi:hypothetical protein
MTNYIHSTSTDRASGAARAFAWAGQGDGAFSQ